MGESATATAAMATASEGARARWAGALYLAIIAAGISAEVALRGAVVVPGDAAATLAAVAAWPGALRWAAMLDVAMVGCDVGVGVLLYLLLRPAGAALALAALAFRLLQAAVLAASLLLQPAALLAAGQGGEAGALVLPLLELHALGYDVGLVFFGLSCLATAVLLRRSPLFPTWLAAAPAAAGAVYLLGSTLRLLAPEVQAQVQAIYLVPLAAELLLALTLLLRGARARG
ncbi:DUF4386 domain-containing protein [Albimonas sp. CAU 1670]|uniref:DUF4386 domain-containing protein n=1 Tax=Albimonas sp. CAU 1670 TaxID=3032599 RepID=UPI0023DAE07A|nr:DUF4386 domain-containing protein [Albimonas sp. CAU 1670]MDF2234902.1 DUF4386 domain-containing protein [Albimonas sp. CAU 1670]